MPITNRYIGFPLTGSFSGSFSGSHVGDGSRLTGISSGTGLAAISSSYVVSSPNASVPVAALVATSSVANVDIAIVPSGSGAILSRIPDGTAYGGNKRGLNVIDIQSDRFLATYVGSADYSTVIGYYSKSTGIGGSTFGGLNSATGNYSLAIGNGQVSSGESSIAAGGLSNESAGKYSATLGGSSNKALKQASVVMGYYGESAINGSFNISSTGGYNNPGQGMTTIVNMSNGAYNDTCSLMTPNNETDILFPWYSDRPLSAYLCTFNILGVDAGNNRVMKYSRELLVARSGSSNGSVFFPSNPQIIGTDITGSSTSNGIDFVLNKSAGGFYVKCWGTGSIWWSATAIITHGRIN